MPARRTRKACPHGDASTPYPVWPTPGWPLGEDSHRDRALASLSAALMACPAPLAAAMTQLTPKDVRRSLTATPLANRSKVLRLLGLMITPRTVGHQLCRDILARLSRADDHAARHAAAALTQAVLSDARKKANAPSIGRDPVEHWSPALVRVAVWAIGLASVADARMWLWAAQQPWFRPDNVTAHHVAAITAAAKHVIAASPDYRFPGYEEPAAAQSGSAIGEHDAAVDVTHPVDHQDASAGSDHPDTETEKEDCRMTATAGTPSSEAAPTVAQLRQLGDNLRDALGDAVPAAQRVLDCVTADRPPAAADLTVLAAARITFDDAVAAVQATDANAEADTGEAVRAALDDLVASADDASVRVRLAQLRILAAPTDNTMLVDALTIAQQRADALAATPTWTADERMRATTLAILTELAESAAAPLHVMELQQELVQAHPDLALLAVSAAQLTLATQPSTIGTAPPPAGAEDTPDPAREGRATTVAATGTEPAPPPAVDISSCEVSEATDSSTTGDQTPHQQALGDAVTTSPKDERRIDAADAPAAAPPSTRTVTVPDAGEATYVAISDEVAAHARLVEGLASLIGAQRFGMAAAISGAAAWPRSQQSVLRIAALADAVRSETGAINAMLQSELTELDTAATVADSPSALLVVVSLLRAALVTGEPTAGAVLNELASRVEPNLSAVAEQVGRRALQGVLVGAPPLTVLADVTEIERSLRAISDAARAKLRPRTLRFKRATDIAKAWMAPDGLLGRPLTVAATDDRSAVNEVASAIRRLGEAAHVSDEIDILDRKYKGMSGKRIEGAGRQDLVNLVAEAVQTLADWTKAVLSLQRSGAAQEWSTGEVADMRATVLDRRAAVLDALTAQSEHTDPILAAASRAAAASLTLTFAVLDGSATLPSGEPTPAFAITAELLKVPGAIVDTAVGRVTVPDDTTVDELLDATRRTWADAVTTQVAAENFDAAHFLLTAAESHQLPGYDGDGISAEIAANVASARHTVRAELEITGEQLSAELRRARTNNEVSEEQAGELTGILRDADAAATGNLAAVRGRLERVAELLPLFRAEAARRLSERLGGLPGVDSGTIERVTRLIDSGQLSTAEELIYFLEIGEPVPEIADRPDLQQFFPAVPNALPVGLTTDVIAAIRDRGQLPRCSTLDFSRLSPDLAELAALALDAWRQLAKTPPEARYRISERDLLLPALRVVGIEGNRIRRLDELPRDRDRRFLDVVDVTVSGKALVPAFGSKLGGRLRVLLAWGQPPAKLLLSHADQDNSGGGLLVAYFGTMSAQTRRELTVHAVADNRSAPVVVLDDAALAYLAAHGNRQMDATMSVLLPFSNVNPYVSKKRGLVAEEMFYGRDAERKGVLDPDGTQLLYGGRGLGKSAVLRSAGQLFESQGALGERVSLYLSLDTVGIRAGSAIGPEAIWDALLRDLTAHGVITPPRRQSNRSSPHEQVRAGVLGWLAADPRRRLLVLLDETDRFFESDAPEFLQTNRLKELGLTTDGRIKVVFAGLHSVQRYAKSARNGPFSHLAQRPTVIGPLRPQWAANLLTRPLQALGYRFADDDLVNRVLGYCSYQPFLLQMFGWRLVSTMHTHRAAGIVDTEPPYVITQADVIAVESNVDLKADISAAFYDTLHLDPRYNVIANVLAHHAHESGLDARLSDVELRDECLDWWHAGFATLDVEGFRAYVQEMVGLGVLAPNNDGRGWHLRSPNVLHMIGSKDNVITQLVDVATLSVPDEFIALETRAELPGGRRSPLTAGQIDDVLGDHANQVRVVFGSSATGIGHVAQAVRQGADVGNRFTVPVIASRRQFEEELVAGQPGQRRVVLTDLVSFAPRNEACTDALTAALEQRPQRPGVTRSAVIVAGPQQMSLWRTVIGSAGHNPALGTVTLRRFDRQTLRVWALAGEKFGVQERLERLLEVTSGWPMLVERAAALVADGKEEGQALTEIADELASSAGAAAFVDAVGVTADEELVKAFSSVLTLVDGTSVTLADLVTAASMAVDEPETAVACLQALGVFDIEADGKYRLEPLLVRSWPHRA